MSTPINYAKSILLAFTICLTLLGTCGSSTTAQEIQWRQSLDEAKAEAIKTKRLVWLHFEADWCVPCKKLETFVFRDLGVIRTSDRNVVAVKIDADENDLLVRKLGVSRVPYDIVMTPEGETIVNRPSPQNSADYLKMFNSLDVPLQALNTGDRVAINAGINHVQKVVEKAGGLKQNKSALDLEGPSHQMAATTVEGQRLERSLGGRERAAELRALEAKLLKREAKIFIAEEEQRLKKNQGPKVTENPFFKAQSNNKSSAGEDTSQVVSNQRAADQGKAVPAKSAVVDASLLPPDFGNKSAKQVAPNGAEGLSRDSLDQYEESNEFSFAGVGEASSDAVSKGASKETAQVVKPKLPEFKDRSGDGGNRGDFAYAPIDELKKALKGAAKPKTVQSKPVQWVAEKEKGVRSTPAEKEPAFGSSNFSRSAAKRSATAAVEPQVSIQTDVAVPRPPVMMEGVVKIAETVIPAVEGRLVAGEQPVKSEFSGRRQQTTVRPQSQLPRSDRLLEQVNFFGAEKPVERPAQVTIAHAQPAPQPQQVTIVQAQPAPQPQVVINLNTGAAAQPVSKNRGRIIQQTAVARATAATDSGNRARIVSDDIASSVQPKFALKGKCPVTLLVQGKWVDGKKEIGCVHRDRIYLFASAENREAFLANPDQLSPLLAGFDPVIYEETGKLVEGEERFGIFMGDAPSQRIVLFKTADTRDRFQKEPVKYINVVRSAMAEKAKKNTKLR